jgi:hypothetical protein
MIRIKNTKTDEKGQIILFQMILLVIIMFILALFCRSKLEVADQGGNNPINAHPIQSNSHNFMRSSSF